jgi:hypothetical protein
MDTGHDDLKEHEKKRNNFDGDNDDDDFESGDDIGSRVNEPKRMKYH